MHIFTCQPIFSADRQLIERTTLEGDEPPDFHRFQATIVVLDERRRPIGEHHVTFNAECRAQTFDIMPDIIKAELKRLQQPKIQTPNPFDFNRFNSNGKAG